MRDDHSSRQSNRRVALRYSFAFLLGGILFSYAYNIIVGIVASLSAVASGKLSVRDLPFVYWREWLKVLFVGDEYQTAREYFIWTAQFFLGFTLPILIFAAVSFPLILRAQFPRRRGRKLTIIYLLLYAGTLWIVAMGIASI